MASGLYIHRKKDFHVSAWLVLGLALMALFSSGWLAYRWYTTGEVPPFVTLPASAIADTSVDESPISEQSRSNYSVAPRLPRYLSIPSVAVNKVRILSVGITGKDTLELPGNIHDVGWYKESALPGQGYGTVLLNGHSVGLSSKGPFVGLSNVTPKDKIIIERGDGRKVSYKVVDVKVEPLEYAITNGVKRLLTPYDKNKEGLGLISPTGNWIPRDETYSHRVLVRAVAL